MYYFNDNFYSELYDLIDDELDFEKSPNELDDDFVLIYQECELQPIFTLDKDKLSDLLLDVYEDRFSEDGDESHEVIKAINESIDFDKLNSMIPELWYPKHEKLKLSKSEIISIYND